MWLTWNIAAFAVLLAAVGVVAEKGWDVFEPAVFKNQTEKACYSMYSREPSKYDTPTCIDHCFAQNDSYLFTYCSTINEQETRLPDGCFKRAAPFFPPKGEQNKNFELETITAKSATHCQAKCKEAVGKGCNLFVYEHGVEGANCALLMNFKPGRISESTRDYNDYVCMRCKDDDTSLPHLCGRFSPTVISGPPQCPGLTPTKNYFLGEAYSYPECQIDADGAVIPNDWTNGLELVAEEPEKSKIAKAKNVFEPFQYQGSHQKKCFMQYATKPGMMNTQECIKACLDNRDDYKKHCKQLTAEEVKGDGPCFTQTAPFFPDPAIQSSKFFAKKVHANSAPECQARCRDMNGACNLFIYTHDEGTSKNCALLVEFMADTISTYTYDKSKHICKHCDREVASATALCGRFHENIISGPPICPGDEAKKRSFVGHDYYYPGCNLKGHGVYNESEWKDGLLAYQGKEWKPEKFHPEEGAIMKGVNVFEPKAYRNDWQKECYMQYSVQPSLMNTPQCIANCLDGGNEHKEYCRRLTKAETKREDACFVQEGPFFPEAGNQDPAFYTQETSANSAPECQAKCMQAGDACNLFVYKHANAKNCLLFFHFRAGMLSSVQNNLNGYRCKKCPVSSGDAEYLCGRHRDDVISGPAMCTGDGAKEQHFLGTRYYYPDCKIMGGFTYHKEDWSDGIFDHHDGDNTGDDSDNNDNDGNNNGNDGDKDGNNGDKNDNNDGDKDGNNGNNGGGKNCCEMRCRRCFNKALCKAKCRCPKPKAVYDIFDHIQK